MDDVKQRTGERKNIYSHMSREYSQSENSYNQNYPQKYDSSKEPKKPQNAFHKKLKILKRKANKYLNKIKLLTAYYLKILKKHRAKSRAMVGVIAVFFIATILWQGFGWKIRDLSYELSPEAKQLIGEPVAKFADQLKYDNKERGFIYNKDYSPSSDGVGGQVSGPKFTATFYTDINKGINVVDPTHKTSVTFVPKYKVDEPRQQENRLVYPIFGKKAAKVVTLKAVNLKEDIILDEFQGDKLNFQYDIKLPDELEARMENDGSLGIYGPDQAALFGNVATGSDKDVELLKNAREKAPKTTLVFRTPAPFIKEFNNKNSSARAWFSLDRNELTVHTSGLSRSKYPLTIDPSVYIETASKLMRGNNESNIEFDVDNELIQKGSTTGARFDSWLNALALNENRWNAGTAAAGGFVYSVGGGKADTSMYTVSGTSSWIVPSGVTSITIKSWGAGGGGGGASADRAGGAGGGGGYTASTLTVTPGETLTIYVGGGGKGGRYTAPDVAGDGGGGGGYSGIFRGSTPLIVAAGGGGGGGANGDSGSTSRAAGSAGGAGGGTSGVAGTSNGSTTGGGAGTSGSGGSAGSSTTSGGTAGASLSGGVGASYVNAFRTVGGSNGGGAGGDGGTGSVSADKRPGGGGGGGGYYGGGGGGSGNANYNGGGGGGGGSSYTTGTSTTNTAGSGTTPGNSGDTDRNNAGTGGAGGSATAGPNLGTAGSDGIVLLTVSGAAATATSNVYWSKFNTTSYALDSPNPGTGTCTNWCTNSAYDLPSARAGFTLVAYNGFLFVMGGIDSSGTRQSTVYVAKIGANGEPSLWHPTDTNKNNWVYWYTSATTLSTERSYYGATASNNRLYLLGGQTNASTGGVTTVEYTDIKPTGDIGSWTSTGMTALTSARHNHSVQFYNDRMYVIGGNSSGTLQSSVQYIRIGSSGTMSGSWQSANSFTTARMAWGGNFSLIWGGYIYIAGGCTAVNGSGYCTTVANDVQLSSINADGSVADWNTILNVTNDRIGYGFVAWRNGIYQIGGCKKQDASTGACTWGVSASNYGSINTPGDASTVSNSVLSGTAPCSGGSPYDCHIPPEGAGNGQGGNMSGGAVINNGIIYYVGGCYSVGNNSICYTGNAGKSSDTTYYASIANDGTIVQVSSCTGTGMSFVGSWCVDNNHVLASGLSGFGITLFNNVIYVVGGTDGSDWSASVYYNALNSDGSLNNWSTQTFAAIGAGVAKGYMYTFTRASPSTASTYPGNLYIVGGCAGALTTDNGVDCTGNQYTEVYKCFIKPAGDIETTGSQCTTTGQLQLDSEPGTGGSQGLGVMAGTLYANYIYLIGGQSPNESARGQVMYAKIDSSNNIVAVSGGIWQTSANEISPVRRRGIAFGYNGFLYAITGYNSGETLNDLLFAKINVSDGSIGVFAQSEVTVIPRWDSAGILNNGYVYTLGGCFSGVPPQNCVAMNRTVQTFQLYNNYSGGPANYSASSNLFTTDRIGASSAVYNGYLYVAGGCTSATDCTTATNDVQYASLDASSGAVGTWTATTGTLPAVRAWGQLEVAGGTLYYIGGQDSTATNEQSTVYYGTPSSGNISSWGTASNGLPSERTKHGATVWNNRIYVTGGLDSSAAVSATVYVSPQLDSGGDIGSAWSSTTAFGTSRSGATAIAYANNLYILGGYDGTNYLNDVQYAQIASDGTVGSWTPTTSLPLRMSQGDGFAYNGYMYLFGGRSATTTCDSHTFVSPISANTTIASGNNPTGIGAWYETNKKYTGSRYGVTASYSDGKAYLLGGGCGATITYTGANRAVQTALLSQPQVAKYSRMIDTDSDVFPTKWLMNGLDNSIGARWYMRYRSMNDIDGDTGDCLVDMTTWGQETNFGEITLGDPETYTAVDGSGTDTTCARYYYFLVNIDSSQAFGYPEDVTRGPTIADLSLFFTADPSKRLRHGKTFTGGEQQPLNTPF